MPKKGEAGKIAKTMSKKDVDDFASTKHTGKPEKVKKETKVRSLIRKMVREIMAEIDEGKEWYDKNKKKQGKVKEAKKRDYKAEYKKYGSSDKAKKYRAELNAYNRKKGTYGNGDGKDASHKGGKIVGFEAESKNRGRAEKSRLKKEEKLTEGKGVDKVLDMANNNSFGKLAGKTIDAMSANLFKQVYEKSGDTAKAKIDKMNEKQIYNLMIKIWNKFGKQVRI